MSEYVPTTTDEYVRLVWGLWFGPADYARFDAWRTEHDRQVAERAWDEGYSAGHDDVRTWCAGGNPAGAASPYRLPHTR